MFIIGTKTEMKLFDKIFEENYNFLLVLRKTKNIKLIINYN